MKKIIMQTIHEPYIQPKGTYYDLQGKLHTQEEDKECFTSYSRPLNNEELMEVINELIDKVNKLESRDVIK